MLDALEIFVPVGGLLFGLVLVAVGLVLLLVAAFRVSPGWGLACLAVPFAAPVFVALHWPAARRPFLLQAAGFALFLLAAALTPDWALPTG